MELLTLAPLPLTAQLLRWAAQGSCSACRRAPKTLPTMPARCPAAPKGHSGVQDQPRAPWHRHPSRAGSVPSELNGAFLQRALGLEEKPALPGDGRGEKRGLEMAPAPYKPLVLLGSVPRPCCRMDTWHQSEGGCLGLLELLETRCWHPHNSSRLQEALA